MSYRFIKSSPTFAMRTAWYCLVPHGTAWYCMVLHGTTWYCMVLHGTAWYYMVLHGTAWYCMVLTWKAGMPGHTRDITERPRAPSGVAAFMLAHNKTPYITPSMNFSSGKGVVRGNRAQQLEFALPNVLNAPAYQLLLYYYYIYYYIGPASAVSAIIIFIIILARQPYQLLLYLLLY